MPYGIAAKPEEYDSLWELIRNLNGGRIILNRNGEALSEEFGNVQDVVNYCNSGGVYVDYCGWPMYYNSIGENKSGSRFKNFLAAAGADPDYCLAFFLGGVFRPIYGMPCTYIIGYPLRYSWIAPAYIPPQGGIINASYEAPSTVYPDPEYPRLWIYSAVAVVVGNGWYFYGTGDETCGSIDPGTYASFIRQFVSEQPIVPPPGACDPSKCTSRPVLGFGSIGPCVGLVQQLLIQKGYNPGPVDCQFFQQTESAVKQFQTAVGLYPDGIVGPQTWAMLEAGITEPPRPPATGPEWCRAIGGIWDDATGTCKQVLPPPVPPPENYLQYLLIGGAALMIGAGVYLAVRR